MSVNSVNFGQTTRPYGYDPKKGKFTTEQAMKDFKPGIYDPAQQEKIEKRKKNIKKALLIGAGVTATVAMAVFFKKYNGAEKLKGLFTKFKDLFKGKTPKDASKVTETIEKKAKVAIDNVKAENANGKARKLVEKAISDTPTKAQQKAYDKAIAYVAPTKAQKAAIEANNALAAERKAVAQQVQNLVQEPQAKALEKAKQALNAAEQFGAQKSGIFTSNGYTVRLRDGEIISMLTPDGRNITKPATLFKYQSKIDLNNLELVVPNINIAA